MQHPIPKNATVSAKAKKAQTIKTTKETKADAHLSYQTPDAQ